MGDVLENLFSIIPFVLAILWIMRSVNSRRKKSDAPKTNKAPKGARQLSEAPAEPAPSTRKGRRDQDVSGPLGVQTRESILARIEKIAKTAGGALRSDEAPAPVSEEALYERVESRRIEVPIPEVKKPKTEETKRVLKHIETKPSRARTTSTAVDRIDKLPPVARGMVWSFIFDDPPSLKDL